MLNQLDRTTLGPLFKEARLIKQMTLEQFYGEVTDHVNNLSAVENGNRIIGKRLAQAVIQHHKIRLAWLKDKEGDPFLSSGFPETSPPTVPFYNISWGDQAWESPGVFKEEPEFYVNFRPFNDCSAYLPVYGDSMFPRYANGEIIAIKEVVNQEVILWGEAYLVVTGNQANNLVAIRLLYEHADPNKLILRASNPDFKGDTVIERKAILNLYLIKGKITRNHL